MLLRVLTAVLVLGCVAPVPSAAQDTPRTGGVLKVAIVGEPPSLDIPLTTATLTYELMWHVNESLFVYDKNFLPIPHLAEGDQIADKGLRHTITLRKGVKFHNGKEMTSADVVPSLKRWGARASVGKQLWTNVESIEAKGPYTVVLALKQPSASLLFGLSEPHAAIYPKESLDAAGEGTLKDFIGTGPYRFVEHRPDRHIKIARFKDYAARAEPANGFGGKRTAYLDEMGWKVGADGIRVKDGTRLSFENGCTAGNKQREQVQQLLQQQWRQVGVEMKINNKPAAVLFGDFYRMSKFETILIGMNMGSDPEHSFRIHSKYIPAKGGMGRNSVAYESAAMDKALDDGVRVLDREKRKVAYYRAQDVFADELPYLPIFHYVNIRGARKGVEGFKPNSNMQEYSWNTNEWWIRRA